MQRERGEETRERDWETSGSESDSLINEERSITRLGVLEVT